MLIKRLKMLERILNDEKANEIISRLLQNELEIAKMR